MKKVVLIVAVLVTLFSGWVVFAVRDADGLRAFVAMSKAILTQDTSVFDHASPPPLFGSAEPSPDHVAEGGQAASGMTDEGRLAGFLFGRGETSDGRAASGDSSEGNDAGTTSFAERALGKQNTDKPQFQSAPPRAENAEINVMPRDFTDRGRQNSNLRRITIGE